MIVIAVENPPAKNGAAQYRAPAGGFTVDEVARAANAPRVSAKVAELFSKRMQVANEKFATRVKHAFDDESAGPLTGMAASMDPLAWYSYSVDAAQRSILFWNTLRQRGDNFLDNTSKGLEPVLHFESETVLDGRSFERPVNYALLRITPPAGVTVNA